MQSRNKKPIALIMLILVVAVMASYIQSASSITLDSAFVKRTTQFGEEFITTFEIPKVLSEEQERILGTVIPIFFQEDLPLEFQEEAQRQREVLGERDLLEEQIDNPTNTEQINIPKTEENTPKGVTSLSASKLVIDRTKGDISSGGLSYLDITDNTFIRGDAVRLVGQFNLNKPAPYFYNVIITCCEMNSFKAMTAVPTDAQGNFVLKFATNRSYPLGDWQVELTTIGDSDKILLHTYYFTLLNDV